MMVARGKIVFFFSWKQNTKCQGGVARMVGLARKGGKKTFGMLQRQEKGKGRKGNDTTMKTGTGVAGP